MAGKGKVENLKPWKPGQSGNANGRPRTKILREIAREVIDEQDPKKKKKIARQLIESLIAKAKSGSLGHFQELLKLLEEDAGTDLRLAGPGGEPLNAAGLVSALDKIYGLDSSAGPAAEATPVSIPAALGEGSKPATDSE